MRGVDVLAVGDAVIAFGTTASFSFQPAAGVVVLIMSTGCNPTRTWGVTDGVNIAAIGESLRTTTGTGAYSTKVVINNTYYIKYNSNAGEAQVFTGIQIQ